MLQHDPRRERLVNTKIQGLLPCNLKRTLGSPFARQEVLQAWEPACSLQRNGSCKAQFARESRVAVQLLRGQTDTQLVWNRVQSR